MVLPGTGYGGYLQSTEGLPDLNDPTQKIGDDEYRDMLRAKAIANNVDGTLVDIYNYLVSGYQQTNPTVEDSPDIIEVTIHDSDLLTKGERHRIFAHGPRDAATDLRFKNWTLEYLPFEPFDALKWEISAESSVAGFATVKTLMIRDNQTDFASFLRTSYYEVTLAQAAYGTWDWWSRHHPNSTQYIVFCATNELPATHASQDGYALKIDTNDALSLIRINSGSATELFKTANSYVSWGAQNFNVVRAADGAFTVQMNDTDVVVASGSNPVTDNTITSAGAWVLDFGDASAATDTDNIALVDVELLGGNTYFESSDTSLASYEPL